VYPCFGYSAVSAEESAHPYASVLIRPQYLRFGRFGPISGSFSWKVRGALFLLIKGASSACFAWAGMASLAPPRRLPAGCSAEVPSPAAAFLPAPTRHFHQGNSAAQSSRQTRNSSCIPCARLRAPWRARRQSPLSTGKLVPGSPALCGLCSQYAWTPLGPSLGAVADASEAGGALSPVLLAGGAAGAALVYGQHDCCLLPPAGAVPHSQRFGAPLLAPVVAPQVTNRPCDEHVRH